MINVNINMQVSIYLLNKLLNEGRDLKPSTKNINMKYPIEHINKYNTSLRAISLVQGDFFLK